MVKVAPPPVRTRRFGERAGDGERRERRTAADAEVALFLVDEAVLNLLGTKTPDPFAFFYRTAGARGGERGQRLQW